MNIPVLLIIAILFAHFVADFIVQTDWQAVNKSKSLNALARHVGTYTLCLMVFGPRFALINGALHFCVDFVTSRISSRLWAAGRRHAFFVCIGADQLTHETCLLLSASVAWWLR